MAINKVYAVVAVANFEAAIAWYERLFGRDADNRPMEGFADWHVTATGGIQVFRDFDRAGGGAVTLIVDDLVEHVAGLTAADLPVGPITTGDMARFATIADPEGNTIASPKPSSGRGNVACGNGIEDMMESGSVRQPASDIDARAAVSDEQMVQANGVDLCVQTFGNPGDPAVMLIAGTASSMDWWEEEFCRRLARGERYIIRYDHRDTGRSVSYEPGAPSYTLRDLAADAIGVLDVLRLNRAHLVGISMGGWIAQLLALDRPDRVASLTLISTRSTGHGPSDPDLPEISEELQAVFAAEAAEPDWSDRTAVIDYLVESQRPFAGSLPFNEASTRVTAARVFDRTANLAASMINHVVADQGDRWRERLGEIGIPTLVIHGAADSLFPLDHARALAREIPGAELLTVDRMGHELPRAVWDVVIPAIVRHTS